MSTTQQEVQARIYCRAHEIAVADKYPGPGLFTMTYLRAALAEASPEERELYAGLAPPPVATALNDAHYLLRTFTNAGMTAERATERLKATHPATFKRYEMSVRPDAGETLSARMQDLMRETPGLRASTARAYCLAADPELKAAVANVPPESLGHTEAERRNFARLVGASPSKVYATNQPSNPWHVVLPQLNRDELVRLVSKGVLTDSDITEWCVVNVMGGRKPIGLSPGLAGESQAWDDKLAAAVRAISDAAQLLKIREGGRSA